MNTPQYTAIFTLLALVPATLAGPAPAPGPLDARAIDNIFEKRACGATKCLCNGVQGQFCGDQLVNSACLDSHVYECQAGTGKACDYGVRDSCKKCGKLNC
ncbi:hypothetical protein N7478_012439 [Penicillium angulare]|uniref:uncharacterized protein n=1 Tax=Penicillium angulare TaxID=116970 RepID=UPI002541D77C|nr:uncharacterized protein N7478_012439 [Penicillium angulare]KAJ5259458.1 hypothetical protein N7478_012439 [Penicillium angulare]